MIPVTKPFFPPIKDYEDFLKKIWAEKWITNNGIFVRRFEDEIKKYLKLKNFVYVSNGTTALQMAIKSLRLFGDIITTPFSFVATASSIAWEGCRPILVDIDPETFNLDPSKIEATITSKTTAILATHVFGNPCNVEAIEKIAKQHKLKVIYDAAHCFGTQYKGESILNYGDISIISFHATKLFHTGEGGGLVTAAPQTNKILQLMRNFGINETNGHYDELGINGKNSELHAALGLANLKWINEILKRRQEQWKAYDLHINHPTLQKIKITPETDYNYSYYPLLFESESQLLECVKHFQDNHIFPRRYFYPPLTQLPYMDKFHTPIAEDVSHRILCLPIYHDLEFHEILAIAQHLKEDRRKLTLAFGKYKVQK